jgi:5-methylthioadenosine/S-adenosylhomocysteine deaminase
MSSLQIIHARWIVPIIPKDIYFENFSIVFNEKKIIDLLPTIESKSKYSELSNVLDLSEEHVLIPGLINMHCHSPMSLLRGFADDVPLMEWLQHYMWPAEQKWISEEFIRVGSMLSVAELIRAGVTTLNDGYFFTNIIGKVIEDIGIRAMIGSPILMFPTTWANTPEEYIKKGFEEVEKWKGHDKVRAIFAPHAPFTVDDNTFLYMKEISDKNNIKIHLHLHETKQEVDDHLKNEIYQIRPIERLNKLGLLNKNLIAVHMTQLEDAEIELIAKSGVNVVNCPESNLKLGSGMCPVNKLVSAGVNVCLGTDGPASNDDLDLLGEMRTSALLDKYSHNGSGKTLTAWQMLAMTTINGAKALGLDNKIGSLETGKEADIVAIRLKTHPVYDPLKTLVYVGTNRVEYVWVGGKCLLKNTELTTIDEKICKLEAEKWFDKIISWDTLRKKTNILKVNNIIHDSQQADDEIKKKIALESLISSKDDLFHWKYFESKKNSNEKILKEIEEAISKVSTQIEILQGKKK